MTKSKTSKQAPQMQSKQSTKMLKTDQKITAPAAKGIVTTTVEPQITRSSKGMRIKHRELYDGQIPGTAAFSVHETINLQPGLVNVFSWLAPQAAQWEQYKVHSMSIEYIPIVGSNVAGDIILSPDYSSDYGRVPTTEQSAVNSLGAVTNNVWNHHTMKLDVEAMMGLGPRRFVRSNAIAGDIKTFDVGQVFVCTNNCSTTNSIGKIFINYDIEFFVPIVGEQNEVVFTPNLTLFLGQASTQSFADNTGALAYYPYFDQRLLPDPLGILVNSPNPALGQYVPPAGCYRVSGVCSFINGTNEDTTVGIQIVVDQTPVTDFPKITVNSKAGAVSSPYMTVPFDGVLSLNGDQAVGIETDFIAATGPLNLQADRAWISFTLA
jgi:hypothetical protein